MQSTVRNFATFGSKTERCKQWGNGGNRISLNGYDDIDRSNEQLDWNGCATSATAAATSATATSASATTTTHDDVGKLDGQEHVCRRATTASHDDGRWRPATNHDDDPLGTNRDCTNAHDAATNDDAIAQWTNYHDDAATHDAIHAESTNGHDVVSITNESIIGRIPKEGEFASRFGS